MLSTDLYNMEHHVNAIEDALIEPLKYKLEPGAN